MCWNMPYFLPEASTPQPLIIPAKADELSSIYANMLLPLSPTSDGQIVQLRHNRQSVANPCSAHLPALVALVPLPHLLLNESHLPVVCFRGRLQLEDNPVADEDELLVGKAERKKEGHHEDLNEADRGSSIALPEEADIFGDSMRMGEGKLGEERCNDRQSGKMNVLQISLLLCQVLTNYNNTHTITISSRQSVVWPWEPGRENGYSPLSLINKKRRIMPMIN
ncbi:hypothetical protein WR25_08840 [Diploscapter pachys]|uniref:Uncharacterized protein n=1 Tax=Diploscapter pachys TaxID=2018661 RepID=A0A2A2JBE1_9BILA|nr:hypothetical protein WR25_08840 [Diploscapter pachys]